MLYVFDVAKGAMLTFDAKFAFERVLKLKNEIEKKSNIRVAYQILLMSGGESLELDAQVSSYSTGTDTNPVYLINKFFNDMHPISLSTSIFEYENINCDLQKKVANSSNMPLSHQTLVERIKIAQEFYKLTGKLWKLCEDLVKIQHFQCQGWTAAVIHLDDLAQNCHSNGKILEQFYESHVTDHQEYLSILNNINKDMEILKEIPMLSKLKKAVEIPTDVSIKYPIKCDQNNEELTLLNWISAQQLNQLNEQCSRGFKRFNNRTMNSLKHEIYTLTEMVTKINLKEIKQIHERLHIRKQLMHQMTKLLQNQAKIVQNFINDYNRIFEIKDKGSKTGICLLHHAWLLLMLRNHTQLRYIWRRCIKDKDKMAVSIQLRLRWMTKTQIKIVENNAKIIKYKENLNRLYNELEILRQIHSTPEMYISAVTEVVRRRNFSQQFFTWTSKLVSEMQSLYNQELNKRREFHEKFEGHFLNELFTGLEDVPPPFATKLPSQFDINLPNLTIDDLEYLKNQLRNLNFNSSLENLNIMFESFISKDILGNREQVEECRKTNDYKKEEKRL
jgi:RB1-inducible coiled-coil protein 1